MYIYIYTYLDDVLRWIYPYAYADKHKDQQGPRGKNRGSVNGMVDGDGPCSK